MVDFKLTEEQKQYQQLAIDFAQKEIAPVASKFDRSSEIPESICRKAWELGLMNLNIPEEYGGLGLPVFDATVITEELAYGCAGITCTINANNLACAPLVVAGTPEQKKEFLGMLTSDFGFASYCVAEDINNSWNTACNTSAKIAGDVYVISGKKIAAANAASAKWFLVVATTGETNGKDNSHLSAFVIPKDLAGISVGPKQNRLGLRAFDVREVTFNQVKIPSRFLVGKVGQAWEIIVAARTNFYPLIAATAVGIARASMDVAVNYSKERYTFGQPIAMHQAIRLMIADMAKDIEAARLLAFQAAWLSDHKSADTQASCIAKAFAQDMAMSATTNAVQVLGGYGYSKEYPVEKLMRDAKTLQIYEGTSNHEHVSAARQFVEA